MDPDLLILAALIVMVLSLLLIPLGFPGGWLMLAALGVAAWEGEVAWWVWGALIVVVAVSEVAEYLIVERTSARYGGSRRAFWGAMLGGLIGVLVGLPLPVPLLGPLLAGLLGTFAGATVVAFRETREVRAAGRVGWGAVLGRAFAAAFKTAAGVVVLVVGGAALLLR